MDTPLHNGATPAEISEFMAITFGRRRQSRKKNKRRGRRGGSRSKLSPDIVKKLGDATLHYAYGRFKDAISLLTHVVRIAPHLPDAYHRLGLVYNSMGHKTKAMAFYDIAARLNPKQPSLWKLLVDWSIEEGNTDQALKYLDRAINADRTDITLRYRRASLHIKKGEYSKAAESYDQVVQICPNNVEALKTATKLHKQCGEFDQSISMLEEYFKNQSSEADLTVVDILALSYMERNEFMKALQHIEHAKAVCGPGKEFPLYLMIREGICRAHLGDMEKAEVCFNVLQSINAEHQMDLIMAVADSFVNLQQHESALKYYMMLESCMANNELINSELVNSKIAHCYSALNRATSAIYYFHKVLKAREDDIDSRLALVSHLLEEKKEDEAIVLLTPPPNPVSTNDMDEDRHEPWWLNVKVKLKLSRIYKTKGMLEAFVEVIHPIVRESIKNDSVHQKAKQRKWLQRCELSEKHNILDSQTDSALELCGSSRRPASKVDLLKAYGRSKEEKISTSMIDRLDSESDDSESDNSESEVPLQPLKPPPLPDLFKDEEHFSLILDLCMAMTSLGRYNEALELIKLTLKRADKASLAGKKEQFWSLGAKIALDITDPSDGFDFVRYVVQKYPHSIAAWNCYYRLVLRLENRLSKRNKFLYRMRVYHKDLLPPKIIAGNQFTMISQHQIAAIEYLEAYKQMPENPLINLCTGTALVNLALGLRLQNKHHCVTQGLAFLYNNLRICKNSQEALYNIARAYHHVGLVTLAANYYEKVLAIYQKDCPLPELFKTRNDPIKDSDSGYCNLHREAAYNLHLIYKNSGAHDLARQVLRDYCTV
ncbi:uncharacterized protein LOC104894626 isoform X2 [Beta vulgaris subsp. vulgaris]|uniref:uncharacterized protein LOC104894626 isoform X2 n=1 Tax=Beta vulgaris subsp. vulgaris TaxID=3555 RepID=UPI002036BE38|nr:uncharacterized protein LOC104894626 isoform X2 [Beta vulgaris subsp. vulgaris]